MHRRRGLTTREWRCLPPLAAALLALLAPARSEAAGAAPRLRASIDDLRRAAVVGTHPPRARAEADAGRLAAGARLGGVTLALSRTAAQEAELQALLAAQHDPASPRFHRWLDPEAFAARFGVADEDLDAIVRWAEGHGLRVESISRARDRLRLAGTVAQLEEAFGTELHTYEVEGTSHFAPAADVTVPAALSPLVRAVTGLSSFRPIAHVRPSTRFTSNVSARHYLTPGDVDVIYHVGPARTAGLDGTGVAIAVVGQSDVSTADLEAFQTAAGLPVRAPQLLLVPGTGSAVHRSGDEDESDLDLEWSSAMAPGASIVFVYVGSATNQSAFDALQYAVDHDVAPIISVSYGTCEPALGAADHASLEGVLAQAAAQGQSIVVASGDAGSLDCAGIPGVASTTQQALAVDYPAASAHATAVGGTEFSAADVSTGNTLYWTPATGTDVVVSARSYVPEQVWNDGPGAAGGGGVSVFTPRPSWQAGVTGLPAGTRRVVPDLSLDASSTNAPFLYCSGGSCANGFRDPDGNLTTAGGTSFGAPIFAGMLALLEQKLQGARQGVVAPTLYRLASDAGTYATAFHDVTAGGNQCLGNGCSAAGASAYAAGVGYDAASGLGSIDLTALLDAWPAPSPGFTVVAADTSVAAGGTGASALTVVPVDGYAGTIRWTVTSTPALGAGCLSISDTAVRAGRPAAASLAIRASADACTVAQGAAAIGAVGSPGPAGGPAGLALAGVLGLVLSGRGARRQRRRWGLAALLVLGLGLPACGGGESSGGDVSRAATGRYAVQVVGTDAGVSTITATADLTLTIR